VSTVSTVAIRIVLAEDNTLLREGIRSLIEAQEGLELVGTADDYDSLLRLVEAEQPDVVLTDIRMPPTGTDEGIRAANHLRGGTGDRRRRRIHDRHHGPGFVPVRLKAATVQPARDRSVVLAV